MLEEKHSKEQSIPKEKEENFEVTGGEINQPKSSAAKPDKATIDSDTKKADEHAKEQKRLMDEKHAKEADEAK